MKKLSPKQEKVIQLSCKGLSYREIASALDMGRGSVNTHITRAYKKLNAKTTAQAIYTYMIMQENELIDRMSQLVEFRNNRGTN